MKSGVQTRQFYLKIQSRCSQEEQIVNNAAKQLRFSINELCRVEHSQLVLRKLWTALDIIQLSEQTLCLLVLAKTIFNGLPKDIKMCIRKLVAEREKVNLAFDTARMYNNLYKFHHS